MIQLMSKPLIETNPYLVDPQKREKLLYTSVCTSTAIEGVKVTFVQPKPFTEDPGQTPFVKQPAGSYGRRR
jgi:hypothetical protein